MNCSSVRNSPIDWAPVSLEMRHIDQQAGVHVQADLDAVQR